MKITLHRALAQRKTTKDRLTKALGSAVFIDVTTGTSGKVRGISIADTEKNIKASYDQIQALISNLQALNKAITAANAGITSETTNIQKTSLENETGELTLADIIQLKEIQKYRKNLLTVMTYQLTCAKNTIESGSASVAERCDKFLAGMAGGDKAKMSKDDIASYTKQFHENNDLKTVDPLGLTTLCRDLQKKFDDLDTEIDSKNSELNALTMIEVDLK
jgi:hypothetical protein